VAFFFFPANRFAMSDNAASPAGGGPVSKVTPDGKRKTLHLRLARVERLADALRAVIEAGPPNGGTPYNLGEVALALGYLQNLQGRLL
jgi:hypothetical protein